MKKHSKLGLFKSKGRLNSEPISNIDHLFKEIEIELFIVLLLEDLNIKPKFLLILKVIIIEQE